MGVDIHVHVESYNKEIAKWEEEAWWDAKDNKQPVYDGRNYGLFGILAGVCSTSGSLVSPRGLPDDLSDEVKEEWGDGKYWFSPTWYDYCELEAYVYALSSSAIIIRKLLRDYAYKDYVNINFCGVDLTDNIRYSLRQIDALEDFMDCINHTPICGREEFINPGDVRIIMWFDC